MPETTPIRMLNGRRVTFGTVTDGQVLILSGEKIIGTSPSAPGAHATTHQSGGTDQISVAGLTGLLGTAQTPAAHATSHKNAGSDEISTATPAANVIPKADSAGCLPPGFQPIKLSLSADMTVPGGYGIHFPTSLTVPADRIFTLAADAILEVF